MIFAVLLLSKILSENNVAGAPVDSTFSVIDLRGRANMENLGEGLKVASCFNSHPSRRIVPVLNAQARSEDKFLNNRNCLRVIAV
jgi:hypothetical protein